MTRTLVITNDFPPRPGGIQAFVHGLVSRRPAGSIVVYAPSWEGAARHDAQQPFPVERHPSSLMLPQPSVLRRAREIARSEGCTSVLYGAAAPLGLLTPYLRRSGIGRFVALTHGHEAGWTMVPAARRLLRRIGDEVDVVTYLGAFTFARLSRTLSPGAVARMVHLPPGVDVRHFAPGRGGQRVRARLGLHDRPVVVCVSRLVPRKGQDVLIRAWPQVLEQVPRAALLFVGGGPDRQRLERLVDAYGMRAACRFTGSVPADDLPAYYDAGDVFAMPCRSRFGGLDTEGLGMVYLEAAATELPVVAGEAGGAAEAVHPGETGQVLNGRSVAAVAETVTGLLHDPGAARSMGRRGRAWVEREWQWEVLADRLGKLLDGPHPASQA